MSGMSWARKLAVTALLLINPSSDTLRRDTSPGMTCWSDRDDFHSDVLIDEDFTDIEAAEVEAATDEWRRRTDGVVDLRVVGRVQHKMIFAPVFWATGHSLKVYRVNKYEAMVWPKGFIGYTGFNAIAILSTRLGRGGTYSVALHEIGHELQLEHSEDEEDLMFPACKNEDCARGAIGLNDLAHFCVEVRRLKQNIRRTGLR